jgi:nucleotide-binding universal stress UspA family protein
MTTGASSRRSGPPRFRRILMALDSGYEDVSSVEAAAALAARLRAELLGLFVEDIDLVRLAELPEVSTYSMLSAGGRRLAADQLKRVLRMQLARSRQAIEQAAARRRIKFAFQVRQGRLVAEVSTVAGISDLVVVGWSKGDISTPWATTRMAPVATAQAVAEAAARSVLLLRPTGAVGGPVLVAYDGSDESRQALAAAAEIADLDGGVIEVALLTGRLDRAEAWQREVETTLADVGSTVKYIHLPKAGLDDLCKIAERQGASLMVLGADLVLKENEPGRRLLERVRCSVLMVR